MHFTLEENEVFERGMAFISVDIDEESVYVETSEGEAHHLCGEEFYAFIGTEKGREIWQAYLELRQSSQSFAKKLTTALRYRNSLS